MSAHALAIQSLPQAVHFPESRIQSFLSKLDYLGEDTAWHIKRLSGFGGSEMGSLLRDRFRLLADASGDSFKTADQVVMEKLLRKLPMGGTAQTERGTNLEPLIRDVFRRRYDLQVYQEGFDATRQHRECASLLGNIDDSLCSHSHKLLVDYKSSVNPYASAPFDYKAQLTSYSAIARSNNVTFDKHLIVGFHAAEILMQGLGEIAKRRDVEPENYLRWVDHLAAGDVPGLELKAYPVAINQSLEQMITDTASQYWNDYVLEGRLLPTPEPILLSEEKNEEIALVMGKAAHGIAVKKAGEDYVSKLNDELKIIVGKTDPRHIKFPDDKLVSTRINRTLDTSAAVGALEAADVEASSYQKVARNIEALEAAFVELGGKLDDPKINTRSVDKGLVKKALLKADLPIEAFEIASVSLQASTKKKQKSLFLDILENWKVAVQEASELQAEGIEHPEEVPIQKTQSSPELSEQP
jgi:hypothetical protein